ESFFNSKKMAMVKVRNFSLYAFGGGTGPTDLFFTFLDANTAAFGERQLLEKIIRVRFGEEQGLFANSQMSSLVSQANGSGIVWRVMSSTSTRLAMQQLMPDVAQFPEAHQLTDKLRALIIGINAGSGVEAHFQAVCPTPDDANTFAALMQAGLMYRRYQV